MREQPPGGGPVAALRAGLAEGPTDVVVLLAGDLPFLTGELIESCAAPHRRRRPRRRRHRPRPVAARRLADGGAAGGGGRRDGPESAAEGARPAASGRCVPPCRPGTPPPWLDCDTPADLARARQLAEEPKGRTAHAHRHRRGPRAGRPPPRPAPVRARRHRRRHRPQPGPRGRPRRRRRGTRRPGPRARRRRRPGGRRRRRRRRGLRRGAGPGSGTGRKDTVDRAPPSCSPTPPSGPPSASTC